MKAFLQWNTKKMAEVKRKMVTENGLTSDEFESILYYKPSFFQTKVERIALPPRQLYYRVRAVLVTFGKKIDSKSKKPLFNTEAWKKG